jgi:outer membrane protein
MYLSKSVSNSLLTCGIASAMFFASCDNKKSTESAKDTKTTPTATATAPTGKIAYVDMDTLEAKYDYLKAKKAELEKKTAALDAEVGKMAQNLQNEYAAFQKKAQAGTLTQAEGEAGQKRLGEMQQNIETRRQTLGAQLMKEQEAFTKDLQSRLDAYLLKYNANKGYDYILSYAKGGSILFANKALDITADVVKGMNAESSGTSEDSKDATK